MLIGLALLATAQNTKIVFDANYVETGSTFDGEYLVLADGNAPTYTLNDEGLMTGKLVTYHNNGLVETVGGMYKGEKNGTWTSWNEAGNKINEGEFMYGAKDGLWRVWDDNGTLRYEMHYRNGKRVHTWKVYNEAGALVEEKSY